MLSDFDTWCKQQFEWKNYYYRQSGPGSMVVPFAARAFEAARNADTALIRQLVEALDEATTYTASAMWSPSMTNECKELVAKGRARLDGKS